MSYEKELIPAKSSMTYEYGRNKLYVKFKNFTDKDIEVISVDDITINMLVVVKNNDDIITMQKTIKLDSEHRVPLHVEIYENTDINYNYKNEDNDFDELVIAINYKNQCARINSCLFKSYLHSLMDIKYKTQVLKNYKERIVAGN